MLYLAYIGEAKTLNLSESITKLFIVRKPKFKIPEGFTHVPQLSPSEELFNKTQTWKKNVFDKDEKTILEQKGISFEDKDAWWSLYIDVFLKELKNRPDMLKALNRLECRLEDGEDVYLFCFCKDVDRCHRGLIGTEMVNRGYEVDFRRIINKASSQTQENVPTQLSLFD